jgi:hypothetical protein
VLTLTDETRYFLSNPVPGRDGWSLRKILRVAFGRWSIEDCFRETKMNLVWITSNVAAGGPSTGTVSSR